MSLPHFLDKHKYPSILKPEAMLSFRGMQAKDVFRGIPSAIFCFHSSSFKYLAKRLSGRKIKGFLGNTAILKKNGHRIVVAQPFGFGAPATAVMLEELAVCGINRCIALGICGSLQSTVAAGDIVVPTGTVRDEGTSHHYISTGAITSPSEVLLQDFVSMMDQRNLKYTSGQIWTTDAPYRETAEEISMYQHSGVLGVDMETSAFLSVSLALKMKSACCLVAADSFADGKWHPCRDKKIINTSMKLIADAAVETLLTQ